MRVWRRWTAVLAILTALLLGGTAAWAETLPIQGAPITYAANTRSGMVRVYLSSLGNVTSLDVTIAGSYSVSGGSAMVFQRGETVRVSMNASSGELTLTRGGQNHAMGRELVFQRHMTDGANGVRIAQSRKPGNLYPGDLRLVARQSGGTYRLYPIVSVYIESYLEGVLPYEMGGTAPIEALKAQAVAARTYTLGRMNARSGQLYDVVDTTSDQVYYGNADSTGNCSAAVNATRGIALMNDGQPTATYYTASNGGQTEAAQHFFNTSNYPYLGIKDDPFDRMNPNAVVRKVTVYGDNAASGQNAALKDLLYRKATATLSAMGYDTAGAQVERITGVTPHTPKYPAPSRLYTKMDFSVTVSTRSSPVSLNLTCDIFGELETALGMNINAMQNELWTVEPSGSNFLLKASRFGHGVGMSQRGAMQMGNLGYTYDQILAFYYEGSERVQYTFTHTILSPIGAGDETITQADAPAEITPSAGGLATVRLVGLEDQLPLRAAADANAAVLTTVPSGSLVAVLARGDAWSLVRLGRVTGYAPTASLVITGEVPVSTQEQPTVLTRWATVVASGTLNLRTSGSMNASVLTQMPSGAALCVFGVSGSWAEVQYGAVSGYASTDFLRFSDTYPGPVTVSSGTAIVRTASGGPVNLRQTPSTSAAVLTAIPSGTAVTVTASDGSWCLVTYGGYEGYVMATYLDMGGTPATAQPETPGPSLSGTEQEAVVHTASGTLNLRAEPSLNAMILAILPRGESIVATARGPEWSAVRYGTVSGYVMTQFLSFPADDAQQAASRAVVTTQTSALNMRAQPQTGSAIVAALPRGARVDVLVWREDGWVHVRYEGQTGYASGAYLTPGAEAATPAPAASGATAVVTTASGTLNLRLSPIITSTVLRVLPRGATVELLFPGTDWCQVRYEGTTGFVMTKYLTLMSAAPTATPVPVMYVSTISGGLNLRESASADAQILLSIPNGVEVTILADFGDWKQIRYGEAVGYVMAQYLSMTAPAAPTATPIPVMYVSTTSGGLNLRESASADARVLLSIPNGAEVTVLADFGNWKQIRYGEAVGYVMAQFLRADAPAAPTATPVPVMYVSTTSGGLNLRESASADARVLLSIPNGAEVTVLADFGTWKQIRYGEAVGYVMAQYLRADAPAVPTAMPTVTPVPVMYVSTASGGLNLRESASADARVLLSIPNGAEVTVLADFGNWKQIRYGEAVGYVMAQYLRADAPAVPPAMPTATPIPVMYVSTTSGGLNLRESASADASILLSIPGGAEVTVLADFGDWKQIRYGEVVGYVMAQYLSMTAPAVPTATPVPVMYVSTVSGGLNLRENASADARVLLSIPNGAEVTVLADLGDWKQIRYGEVIGYVMAQYLRADAPAIPAAPAESPMPSAAPVYDETLTDVVGWHAQVNTALLNVRQWCDEEAPLLTVLAQGATVELTQVGDDWCHILAEGVDGYCVTMYLILMPALP